MLCFGPWSPPSARGCQAAPAPSVRQTAPSHWLCPRGKDRPPCLRGSVSGLRVEFREPLCLLSVCFWDADVDGNVVLVSSPTCVSARGLTSPFPGSAPLSPFPSGCAGGASSPALRRGAEKGQLCPGPIVAGHLTARAAWCPPRGPADVLRASGRSPPSHTSERFPREVRAVRVCRCDYGVFLHLLERWLTWIRFTGPQRPCVPGADPTRAGRRTPPPLS